MTRDEIIQQILQTQDYERLCKSIDPAGDLYQEFLLVILEQTEEQLRQRLPYLKWYCVRIITGCSSYRNKYSNYRQRHVEFDGNMVIADDQESLEDIHCGISKAFESENWYDKELFLAAATGITDSRTGEVKAFRSVLQLSKAIEIPYKTITDSLDATRKRLKEKVQNIADHSA